MVDTLRTRTGAVCRPRPAAPRPESRRQGLCPDPELWADPRPAQEDTIDDQGTPDHLACGPRGLLRPLAEAHDVALLDLDGVVYLDGQAIPAAPAAVAGARERGMRLAFVTNNASRTPHRIVDQLSRLGVRAHADDVVTSAQAVARLVAERVPDGASVLVVGGAGLRRAVREQGLRPVSSARAEPAAVVQGYTPQLSYTQLAEGALAARQGALFAASNGDPTLPSPRGPIPGNGALFRVIAAASGQEPIVAGKPELPLHREALVRSGARAPLVVGDRLDTDIEGAVRAGTPSLLVLSGVAAPAELVVAPPHQRPTYVARDLNGLLETHPATYRDGEVWRCRGWSARRVAGALQLTGEGDACDGLRALCAAVWAGERAGDGPPDPDSLARALGLLDFAR